jgi:hypothetical protein
MSSDLCGLCCDWALGLGSARSTRWSQVVFCEVGVFNLSFFCLASVTEYALKMCYEGITNVFRVTLGLGGVCVEVKWYLVMVVVVVVVMVVDYGVSLLVKGLGRAEIG